MTIPDSIREQVRKRANNQCEYCRVDTELIYAPIEIDHIIPRVQGGSDDIENLCLACPFCNRFKGVQTHGIDSETSERIPLFNPRQQIWSEHFAWDTDNATVIGLTPCGRATVETLQINFAPNRELRRLFGQFGWYPPT